MKHNDSTSSQPEPWTFNQPPPSSDRRQTYDQATLFLVNPKNAPYVSGLTRYRAHKAMLGCTLLGLIILSGAVLVIFFVGRELYQNYQLSQDGKKIPAIITDYYSTGCGDDSTCYHLVVSYSVPNGVGALQNYTRDESVSKDDFNRYSNARVEVIYLPDNPSVAQVVLGQFSGLWSNVIRTGLIILTLLGAIAGVRAARRAIVKRVRLARHGQVLWGNLTHISAREEEGPYTIEVKYTFTNPDGKWLYGKTSQTRKDLKAEKTPLPRPDTPLVILYADDNTHKAL